METEVIHPKNFATTHLTKDRFKSMIADAAAVQDELLQNKTSQERKELGQFFTHPSIAKYMVKMINPVSTENIKLLDPGAGAGILTMAASLNYLNNGNKRVHAVLYEIDKSVINLLRENMNNIKHVFSENDGYFTFEIHTEDFILSRPDKENPKFDLSILNPPYFKYNSKNSPYSGKTEDLFKGNPNIYASFMAVASACLKANGQMITITPRSFKNGLYFKDFRRFLNRTMCLDKIHVFKSRSSVFKHATVLQENIICSYTKCLQSSFISVYTSSGIDDLNRCTHSFYESKLLIDTTNSHQIIRIPETKNDANILKTAEKWTSSFHENGYFVSTGKVVEHRTKKYLTSPLYTGKSVPLLRMHNIQNFNTIWSGKHQKDVRFKLISEHEKHTSLNASYLLLRRFSSKEEKRRLIAGVYDSRKFNSDYIAIDNHLNYIGLKEGNIELTELYGLAALFNSTFMDKYFRCISGSTQVNATEIRLLKMPSRILIKQLGETIINTRNFNQKNIDRIVNQLLNLEGVILV